MSEPAWLIEERDGVVLACADYGGEGTPIVLLHGLAGYAGEWAPTAHHLAKSHRVIAPELRGHGRSEGSGSV
jgi:pimeloyl-ACP methyl ester carboxylesterase